MSDQRQIDIACVVARIEQITRLREESPRDELAEMLIDRLRYDAQRLRQYLDAEHIADLDRYAARST